jgi:outer membrane protein assembly factor BamB
MKRIFFFSIISFAILAFTFTGCEKKKEPKGFVPVEEPEHAEEKEQKEPEDEELKELEDKQEAPVEEEGEEEETVLFEEEGIIAIQEEAEEGAITQGVVTYVSGDVDVNRGGGWNILDVDDMVSLDNRIRTESESFCELQFSDFGIIRVQENTELAVGDVCLVENKNRVNVNLDEGRLLCKVSKLTKGEKFQVKTRTALAGVRGTEFMVATHRDESVSLAVKEGTVTVVPTRVAEKIDEIKVELKTETARSVLEEIKIPEVVVTEDEEIILERAEVESAAKKFEDTSEVIKEKIQKIDKKAVTLIKEERVLSQKEEKPTAREIRKIDDIKEEIDLLKADVISVTSEESKKVEEGFSKPKAVSTPVVQELGTFERMETKEFVIAAKKKPKEEGEEEREPAYTKVIIKVSPRDAKIVVNNEESGKGRFSGLYLPGTEITVKAEKEGFIDEVRKIVVSDEEAQNIQIELKNSPLSWKLNIGSTPYIREVVVSGDNILLADANGKVVCISPEGKNLWVASTKNSPNNNSIPVVVARNVFFSGPKELAVIDLRTGQSTKRIPVGKDEYSSHLFGRRIVRFEDSILYPGNRSILFLDPENLIQKAKIALPEVTNCTPAVHGNEIIMVDQKGTLMKIEPASGRVEATVNTSALQPVSIAPVLDGDRALFAGRQGIIVSADLSQNRIVWERSLDIGSGKGIFQDIVVGKEGVFPFTGNAFHALSVDNGAVLYSPVKATCAPVYHEGKLYFGDSEKRFVCMEAATGKIQKTYILDSVINLQPAVYGESVFVATSSGTIYRLEPGYM